MHIHIVTLFPEFFESPLGCGLLSRAIEAGIVRFHFHNPRKYTTDAHQSVDDRPYGGGPGMVMLLDPLVQALEETDVQTNGQGKTLLMAAAGYKFTQEMARSLAGEHSLTIICGRYEGVDARLKEIYPLTPVSTGPYVLNGGETAALNLIEAVFIMLIHLSDEFLYHFSAFFIFTIALNFL